MVGQPMTYSEALAAVRWRWPDADDKKLAITKA